MNQAKSNMNKRIGIVANKIDLVKEQEKQASEEFKHHSKITRLEPYFKIITEEIVKSIKGKIVTESLKKGKQGTTTQTNSPKMGSPRSSSDQASFKNK